MFKNMVYGKRFFISTLILILLPCVLFYMFFLHMKIKNIFLGYDEQINQVISVTHDKAAEISNSMMQKARVLIAYPKLNDILNSETEIDITPKTLEDNSEVDDMISMIVSDMSSMNVDILTTNENVTLFSNINIISTSDKYYDLEKSGLSWTWKYEVVDDEVLLSLYKKFGFSSYNNFMKLTIPLKVVLTELDNLNIDNAYIELMSDEKTLCVENYKDGHLSKCELPNESFYTVSNTIKPIGLKINVHIRKNAIYRDIIIYIIKISIIVLIILFIAFYISRLMVRQYIVEVGDVVDDIKKNKSIESISNGEKNEMLLIKNYILELRNKFELESNEKLKFESDLLLARLSPHFLYNNLSAIKSSCQNDDARKAIDNLVLYYRNVFQKGSYLTTIKEEVDNGIEYLKLLKFSYEKNFKIDCSIDEQCINAKIPSNILQPILENAFIHGINDNCSSDDGIISIKSFIRDEDILLIVEDNAGNFNKERFLCRQSDGEKRHAFKIIEERMKLYYKDERHVVRIDGDSFKTTVTFNFARESGYDEGDIG